MKRFSLAFLAFLLFICNSAFSGASELEILGGINCFTYNPNQIDAYSDPDTENNEFTYFPFVLANVNLRLDFSEKMNIALNIERDNILPNTLSTLFGLKTDYINVNFGVFAGLAELTASPSLSDTGITGNLELITARTMFFSISGASSLANFTGNNRRETAGARLGFWVGDTSPSISADMKTYSKHGGNSDVLFRFTLNMDFLIKDTNTSGYINGGYQIYSRTYKEKEKITEEEETILITSYTDSLNSCFAGFGFYWYGKPVGFKIGVEVPFLLSAKPSPMTVSNEIKDYLFFLKAYAGFVFTPVN